MRMKTLQLDDATLNAVLESLSEPPADSDSSSPGLQNALAGIPSAHAKVPFIERVDLLDGIDLANSIIAQAGIDAMQRGRSCENGRGYDSFMIPTLEDATAPTAHKVLGAALRAVVALGRSRDANVSLRVEAVRKLESVSAERDQNAAQIAKLRRKATERDTRFRRLELQLQKGEERERRIAEQAANDIADLKSKLVAVLRREAAVTLDLKKRDAEIGRIQKRLHETLEGRRAIVPPSTCIVERLANARDDDAAACSNIDAYERWPACPQDSREEYAELVESSYHEREQTLFSENEELRGLVFSLHEELEELAEMSITATDDQHSDVSDDGIVEHAMSADRVHFPLVEIRDDLESSFREKLTTIRSTLETAPFSRTVPSTGEQDEDPDPRVDVDLQDGAVSQGEDGLHEDEDLQNEIDPQDDTDPQEDTDPHEISIAFDQAVAIASGGDLNEPSNLDRKRGLKGDP